MWVKMNRDYLRKLDESEKTRCGEIFKRYMEGEELDESELFRYKIAQKLKVKQPAFIGGFKRQVLLGTIPFYPTTILEICPHCKCVREPALLEPFLEKNLVIPALRYDYQSLGKKFVDFIHPYPHLSYEEFSCYRTSALYSEVLNIAQRLCSHCISKYHKKIDTHIKGLSLQSQEKTKLKVEIDRVFFRLFPFLLPEASLLSTLDNALRQKDLTKINQIGAAAEEARQLRTAQAFSAIPQLSSEEVDVVRKLIASYPELKADYDISYVRESAMRQLKLFYSPTMSVETYLDIVSRKGRKIQKIVNDCIEGGKPQDTNSLSSLQREVEKINTEIREIESSKKAKFVTLTTGFIAHNPSIIAGVLFGASLGLPIGIASCGAGVVGGGLLGSLVSKKGKVHIPKEAKELTESFIELFDPAYEKFLAHSLSKDIKAIQVWRLQRTMGRSPKVA